MLGKPGARELSWDSWESLPGVLSLLTLWPRAPPPMHLSSPALSEGGPASWSLVSCHYVSLSSTSMWPWDANTRSTSGLSVLGQLDCLQTRCPLPPHPAARGRVVNR